MNALKTLRTLLIIGSLLISGCGGFRIIVHPTAEDGTRMVETEGKGKTILKFNEKGEYTEIEMDSKSEPFIRKTVEKGAALILSREAGGVPTEK